MASRETVQVNSSLVLLGPKSVRENLKDAHDQTTIGLETTKENYVGVLVDEELFVFGRGNFVAYHVTNSCSRVLPIDSEPKRLHERTIPKTGYIVLAKKQIPLQDLLRGCRGSEEEALERLPDASCVLYFTAKDQ